MRSPVPRRRTHTQTRSMKRLDNVEKRRGKVGGGVERTLRTAGRSQPRETSTATYREDAATGARQRAPPQDASKRGCGTKGEERESPKTAAAAAHHSAKAQRTSLEYTQMRAHISPPLLLLYGKQGTKITGTEKAEATKKNDAKQGTVQAENKQEWEAREKGRRHSRRNGTTRWKKNRTGGT